MVRCWTIPPPSVDPYDTYDASVMFNVLEGHQDSVWCLSYNVSRQQLLSCSADGTVKLWSPNTTAAPLVATLCETEEGTPTSCDWVTGIIYEFFKLFDRNIAQIGYLNTVTYVRFLTIKQRYRVSFKRSLF